MKSVIHEASTIGKAIEQGWEKAGKPTEFSIKVMEEAKRGFLGLSSKGAKVVIFFDERKIERRPLKISTENKQAHSGQQQSLTGGNHTPRGPKQEGAEENKKNFRRRHYRGKPQNRRRLDENKPN